MCAALSLSWGGDVSRHRRSRGRRRSTAAKTVSSPAVPGARSVGPLVPPETHELRRLVERRSKVESAIEREVARLSAMGLSWTAIGAALGVTRQGARQRYGLRSGS